MINSQEWLDSLPDPREMSLTDLFGELEDSGDMVAEVEGEKALFGDGPPGSAFFLARVNALRAEIRRRDNLAIESRPLRQENDDDDVPF